MIEVSIYVRDMKYKILFFLSRCPNILAHYHIMMQMSIMMKAPCIMVKAPHIMLEPSRIMLETPRIMLETPRIMVKAPHIMPKAQRIMPKAPRIMLKAPNKMSFDHLRQLWLSIQLVPLKWYMHVMCNSQQKFHTNTI